MTKIYVDDQQIEVKEGQNLLAATLSKGFDLPYFCWHPALGSVGACRQCAVIQYKDADDKKGRLVMSCMTPALEGTRISIDCDEAKSFRASVIEWLMTNHPHDCPVCDEGGECHLQDMTLMSGHNYRRFRFNKRTFKNQNLGPLINHEMNRCITCYRCVRFYRDVAGGDDLNSFSSSNNVFFGRAQEGQLESEFSGNLAEICPTGVFTDKTYKQNYTRKWDLQVAPSVCQMCSLGCNITPGERGGILRRVQNRFHSQINGYFICDKGRFGHGFVNSKERIMKPLYRESRSHVQVEAEFASSIQIARDKIAASKHLVGIGSARASLESNFALRKLVGSENFYTSENERDHECVSKIHSILKSRALHTPSLKEIEEADAILILGEDLTNTAPMMAFSVRQAVFRRAQHSASLLKIPSWNDAAIRNLVREKTGPICSLQVSKTKLCDVAQIAAYVDPIRIEQIGFEIAHQLDNQAPKPRGIADKDAQLALEIVGMLRDAKNPVIISGASLGATGISDAAANIALALKAKQVDCGLSFVLPHANSLGLHVLEAKAQKDLAQRLIDSKADVVISLENEQTLDNVGFLISLDYLNHRALARADLVLPVSSFAESTGSLINNEGRAQRYYQVMPNKAPVQEAWRVLESLENQTEMDLNIDALTNQMAGEFEVLADFNNHVMKSSFRVCGQKIPRAASEQSGRTAIYANETMHEPKPVQDKDSPYSFSMEGARSGVQGAQAAVFWAPKWNSVQALNKFQDEVGGPLVGGPTGVLLFARQDGKSLQYFEVGKSHCESSGDFKLVSGHNMYRSDFRSGHVDAFRQCAPKERILISGADAKKRNLSNNEVLTLALGAREIKLSCEIREEIPEGWLVVPEELR